MAERRVRTDLANGRGEYDISDSTPMPMASLLTTIAAGRWLRSSQPLCRLTYSLSLLLISGFCSLGESPIPYLEW